MNESIYRANAYAYQERGRQTEVRLRMLEDFNDKISVKIREVMSVMDQMRITGL